MPSRNASRRGSLDNTAEIKRLGTVMDNGEPHWLEKHNSMNYNINQGDVEKLGNTPMKGPFAKLSMGSLVSLVLLTVTGVFLLGACLIVAIHRIQEGHVGVYYRNGRLINDISGPGIHWLQPFVTSVVEIRLTPETKMMDPLVCTTQDGVRNVFRDVQIITSIERDKVHGLVKQFTPKLKQLLVFDRVSEAIQIFCANNTIDEVYNTRFLDIVNFVNTTLSENLARLTPNGGLIIWNIFLPKPDVPPAIAANYRQVKVEWTKQLVAQQKQRTEKIHKETERIKAVADAERLKEIQAIDILKNIQKEEGKANVSSIQNEIMAKKRRIEADVSSYVSLSEAESNKELLSDNYVKLHIARSFGNNTKMYFSGGDSTLGAILGSVFNKDL